MIFFFFTTKLRIQSATLTVWVQSDQKLTDLLRGIISLDGILGPATITLIEEDSEAIHQLELRPNKQIDRRGMPFLTNIWSTLGASEPQILAWILLCTSSQLGQHWIAESAILAHPDGPAHLPTIWGSKDQRWHRGHLLLQSETPAVPCHSRDSLAAVSSISNVDRLYATAGLQDALVQQPAPATPSGAGYGSSRYPFVSSTLAPRMRHSRQTRSSGRPMLMGREQFNLYQVSADS